MNKISPTELTTVVGGKSTTNTQITQQLTALQTSLKDVASNANGGNHNNMMMMMMMMAMRPQPTMIAGGCPAPSGPSSIINIRTRLRRW